MKLRLFCLVLIVLSVTGCTNTSKMKVGVAEMVITPPNPVGHPMWGYDRKGKLSMNFLRAVSTKSKAKKGDANPDSSYLSYFISQNIECAVKAWDSRVPGKIGISSTSIFGMAMNDRRMDHGGLAPDNEVAIIKVENDDAELIGVFFNYGCHPSALDLHNLKFTEDWPYFSIEGIREKVGKDVVIGYIQSAQGDAKIGYTAELSAVGAYMYGIRSFEFAKMKGRILSDAVLSVLPAIKTRGDMKVGAAYERFDFPRRSTYPYTYAEALHWQKESTQRLAEKEKLLGVKIGQRRLDYYKVDLWLADQAVNVSKAVESNPNPTPVSMPMQAVRLGDNYFVTFPNEVFTEIGLAVKNQSPFENTFIIGVAGGHQGYIPTKAEFLEQGYAANGSPFAPETEDVLVKAAQKLINKIKD